MHHDNPMSLLIPTKASTLRYLFTVRYDDGTIFEQNPEDVSLTDPKRSAFYDVRLDYIETFGLASYPWPLDGGTVVLVDLRDGSFEVNGVKFKAHDQELTNFRLIFFRRHKHNILINAETRDKLGGSHSVVYRVGWQAITNDGMNKQRVLELT